MASQATCIPPHFVHITFIFQIFIFPALEAFSTSPEGIVLRAVQTGEARTEGKEPGMKFYEMP
ncbi:hypothetical protein HMPREF1981_01648 [Bacteroides pyogenes F0041]|uniref:Uncharacterized protein n=1 Tax=Bacteroides pyogenes F0041 TaxID=1321819 RepID=U2DZT6_9BACE|nr:hypothetical protein HMPREF1981_01648 [Bacteroides pyogenes F0041]